jgi:cyclopropane-fatty-acyl-phospholipid synthase
MSSASEGLFVTEHVENFGPDYDTTLIWWYKNFHKNLDKINRVRREEGKPPLNDRFVRIWDYYLLMCAGSFRARSSQLYQVVYSKGSMPHYPLPSNEW